MTIPQLSVGLVFGGVSPEHEVSIVSARSIASNLDTKRYRIMPIGIARNGVWVVKGDPFARLSAGELPERSTYAFMPLEAGAEDTKLPDIFFNAIHGAGGEDGQLQGFWESLDRPYTAAGLTSMALTMDKWLTKRVWESEGLPVVPYEGVTEEQFKREPERVKARLATLGRPLFLKPANLGSSIGIEKLRETDNLAGALERAFRFDRRVLAEVGIDARELEAAAFGGDDPIISQVGEVLVAGEYYDFYDKYVNGKSSTRIPADIPEEISKQIRTIARQAWRAVDGYGMGRIDFFLCRQTGRVYLNEVNMVPGFTSISMYPKLMEASGVPYCELLTRLIDLALERYSTRKAKRHDFTSGSSWYKS